MGFLETLGAGINMAIILFFGYIGLVLTVGGFLSLINKYEPEYTRRVYSDGSAYHDFKTHFDALAFTGELLWIFTFIVSGLVGAFFVLGKLALFLGIPV